RAARKAWRSPPPTWRRSGAFWLRNGWNLKASIACATAAMSESAQRRTETGGGMNRGNEKVPPGCHRPDEKAESLRGQRNGNHPHGHGHPDQMREVQAQRPDPAEQVREKNEEGAVFRHRRPGGDARRRRAPAGRRSLTAECGWSGAGAGSSSALPPDG